MADRVERLIPGLEQQSREELLRVKNLLKENGTFDDENIDYDDIIAMLVEEAITMIKIKSGQFSPHKCPRNQVSTLASKSNHCESFFLGFRQKPTFASFWQGRHIFLVLLIFELPHIGELNLLLTIHSRSISFLSPFVDQLLFKD